MRSELCRGLAGFGIGIDYDNDYDNDNDCDSRDGANAT